jgi:YARHG domain
MVLEPSPCGAWVRGLRVRLLTLAALCALAAFVLPLFASQPARANCYELIGCTNSEYFKPYQLKQLGCQLLWDVRNTIYKENGYCFHTSKAIKYFGNAGCKFDDVGDVPLNKYERRNISAIKKVEKQKGCL